MICALPTGGDTVTDSQPILENMYLPLLAAELPNGWTVSERSTFLSPSGAEVHATVTSAPEGWTTAHLMAREISAMPADAKAADDGQSVTRVNGNQIVGEQRAFVFRQHGIDRAGRIMCAVDDGIALTITASWSVTDAAAGAEVELVAAGIRLLNRPVAAIEAKAGSATRTSPPRRVPTQTSDWSHLRAEWSAPPATSPELSNVARWSPQELAVGALIVGSPSFPTVGAEEFSGLPRVAVQVTLETVMRSFVARGLVRPLDDGSVALVDELHSMIDTAAFPDLTVLAQCIGPPSIAVTWFGVRTDRAVRIGVNDDGSRECGDFAPRDLVALFCSLWAADDRSDIIAPTTTTTRTVTVADLVEQACDVTSLVQVTTAWRVGNALHGGRPAWATGINGELWQAEQHDLPEHGAVAWLLRSSSADDVRKDLLGCLPGG